MSRLCYYNRKIPNKQKLKADSRATMSVKTLYAAVGVVLGVVSYALYRRVRGAASTHVSWTPLAIVEQKGRVIDNAIRDIVKMADEFPIIKDSPAYAMTPQHRIMNVGVMVVILAIAERKYQTEVSGMSAQEKSSFLHDKCKAALDKLGMTDSRWALSFLDPEFDTNLEKLGAIVSSESMIDILTPLI